MLGPEVLELRRIQPPGEARPQHLVAEIVAEVQAIILSQTRLSAGRQGSGSWPSSRNSGGSRPERVSR